METPLFVFLVETPLFVFLVETPLKPAIPGRIPSDSSCIGSRRQELPLVSKQSRVKRGISGLSWVASRRETAGEVRLLRSAQLHFWDSLASLLATSPDPEDIGAPRAKGVRDGFPRFVSEIRRV